MFMEILKTAESFYIDISRWRPVSFFFLLKLFVLNTNHFIFHIFPPNDKTKGLKCVTLTVRIVFITKNSCDVCINLIRSTNGTQRHSPSLRTDIYIFFFARIFPKTRVVAIPNLTSPHCIMHSSHVVYSYFNQLLCTRGRREGLEVLGIT